MALADLRISPMETMRNYAFHVDVMLSLPGRQLYGVPVFLTESTDEYTIHHLTTRMAAGNAQDYYYPYIGGDVGRVLVSQPTNGTIVVTIGMNGCALEVRYSAAGFTFYHDADGKQMNHKVHDGGVTRCRIEADDYWNPELILVMLAQKRQFVEYQFYLGISRW